MNHRSLVPRFRTLVILGVLETSLTACGDDVSLGAHDPVEGLPSGEFEDEESLDREPDWTDSDQSDSPEDSEIEMQEDLEGLGGASGLSDGEFGGTNQQGRNADAAMRSLPPVDPFPGVKAGE